MPLDLTSVLDPSASADPYKNLQALRVADAKSGGVMTCSTEATYLIGAAAGAASSGVLLDAKSPEWDCPEMTLKVADHQPVNAPAQVTPCAPFVMTKIPSPRLFLSIDCNGAGQIASNALNPWGYYSHGIRLNRCGASKVDAAVLNCRGVAPISTPSYSETFPFQVLAGAGGDDVTLSLLQLDGSSAASGAVWQYLARNAVAAKAKITAYRQRHGFGCYGGGHPIILPGSAFVECDTAINIETGPDAASATAAVVVGDASIPGGIVISATNPQSRGIVINGNATPNGSLGPVRIGGVDIHGTRDGLVLAGSAGSRVELDLVRFDSPLHAAINLGGGASGPRASTLHLARSTVHLTGTGRAVVGGSLARGNGTLALV